MYLLSKLFGVWFHFTNHNKEHPHSNRVRRLKHCIFERIEHTPKLLNVSLTFLISRRLFSSFERRIKKGFSSRIIPSPGASAKLIFNRLSHFFLSFEFHSISILWKNSYLNVRRTFFVCTFFQLWAPLSLNEHFQRTLTHILES